MMKITQISKSQILNQMEMLRITLVTKLIHVKKKSSLPVKPLV